MDLKCGGPLVLISGLKWFVLHVNDLGNISKQVKCLSYPDDTNIIVAGEDFQQTGDKVMQELTKFF